MMTPRKNACCRLLIAASVMASGEDAPEAILLRMVVRFARFASRIVLRNLSPAWKWRGFDVSELPFFNTKPTDAESNRWPASLVTSAEKKSRLKFMSNEPTADAAVLP